jgi:hypothetical protein
MEMALKSRAALAEKEVRLETEIETMRMEAEVADLEKQREQVQRSIRATKAKGEVAAERRKHDILLQAIEEETERKQTSSLLQQPSQRQEATNHNRPSSPINPSPVIQGQANNVLPHAGNTPHPTKAKP